MRERRRKARTRATQGATGRPTVRRASLATKESLLNAAEHLFAEHGIQAVSLRMINAAAGARNASAAHYHFRSRDSLLKAVARRRMDALSEERLTRLRAVERGAGGGLPGVHAIVEAVTLPTFEMLLDDSGGGANYVRFLARAAAEPTVRLSDLASEAFNYVAMTTVTMLHRVLPHVPTAVLIERIMFGFDIGIMAPLRIDRLARHADGSIDREALEVFAARIIDYVAGALAAPVSSTRVALAAPMGGGTHTDGATPVDASRTPSRAIRSPRRAARSR
jgi:AcrR family transcriptional regulator